MQLSSYVCGFRVLGWSRGSRLDSLKGRSRRGPGTGVTDRASCFPCPPPPPQSYQIPRAVFLDLGLDIGP